MRSARTLAALALALAAAGCGARGGGAAPGTAAGAARFAPPGFTPAPEPTWTAAQSAALRGDLGTIFDDAVTTTATGIAVLAGDGSTIFARRASVAVAPASTLKLVVAASALDALGPDGRLVTRFVARALPDADGTIAGPLWLVGGGDPGLTSDQVRAGVGALWRAGVRRIEGPVEIDATAFSGDEQNRRWAPDDLSYSYAAGTSALSLDEDVAQFEVTPVAGGSARVAVVPANQAVRFTGAVATVPAGYSSYVSIDQKLDMPIFGGDGVAADDGGGPPPLTFALDGHITNEGPQTFYKPVVGIARFAGGAVAAMLAKRGIAVAGGYAVGAAPGDGVPLWTHPSAKVRDLVHEMLVNSNNHTAEQLLRALGQATGGGGNDRAGLAAETRELARLGVPRARLHLFDGSGLAPADRIMPLSIARLLASEARGPLGDVYVGSLPRVGIEGTVKSHELHDGAGRVRAKSGHIENVNALAGVVRTRHHGRVAFAIIVNDPRANAGVVYDEMDRALDRIADS